MDLLLQPRRLKGADPPEFQAALNQAISSFNPLLLVFLLKVISVNLETVRWWWVIPLKSNAVPVNPVQHDYPG